MDLEGKKAFLSEARTLLIDYYNPITELAFWCQSQIVDETMIARTDGRKLQFGDQFFDLNLKEAIFVICHELMHVAMRHCQRGAELCSSAHDHHLHNIAADLLINAALVNFDWGSIPKVGVTFDRLPKPVRDKLPPDPTLLSVDELYHLLKTSQLDPEPFEEFADLKDGLDEGSVLDCEGEAPDLSSEGEQMALTRLVEQIMSDSSDQWGSEVGALSQMLRNNLPKITYPWKKTLAHFLVKVLSNRKETNWCRPSTLTLTGTIPFYLPGRRQQYTLSKAVIAIDLSGSCWNETILRSFIGQVVAIQQACSAEITVVTFDVNIQDVFYFQPSSARNFKREIMKCKFNGGGGTSFIDLFRPPWIDRHGQSHLVQPKCMVVLTDLAGTLPEVAPPFPVLWAIPKDFGCAEAPFGKVIAVDSID